MNNTELINNLIKTIEYKKIQDLSLQIHANQQQFDLISVYEELKLINENAWSRLFAYLLDSRKNHGLGQSTFKKLCQIIPELRQFSKLLQSETTTQTLCITEWETEKSRRIDILIKIIDSRGKTKAVVGIENKVDSGEQINQIRDYQKSLTKAFKGIPKVLIYLSPDGRTSKTADTHPSCPAVTVSYSHISIVCEKIKRQTSGQGEIFLSVLKNHIDKITNNIKMDKEIINIINELYANHSHRQALKLINQYSPNIHSVFDDIFKRLQKPGTLPFNFDNSNIQYYPERSSNPHEFKLYIEELNENCRIKGISAAYILRCENSDPDFEDIFTLRLALYVENNVQNFKGKSSLLDKLIASFSFPDSIDSDKHWDKWICIWTGKNYKLKDLGEKDAKALTNLLVHGIAQTYAQLKIGLNSLLDKK